MPPYGVREGSSFNNVVKGCRLRHTLHVSRNFDVKETPTMIWDCNLLKKRRKRKNPT